MDLSVLSVLAIFVFFVLFCFWSHFVLHTVVFCLLVFDLHPVLLIFADKATASPVQHGYIRKAKLKSVIKCRNGHNSS